MQRVDDQGVVLHTYVYDAFGIEKEQDDDNTNPWRYTGEYYDRETGTIYLRARNYNPRTGRFTQPDPYWGIHNMQDSTAAILQAGNLYMYVMHNPIIFIDPSGLNAVLLEYIAEREGLTYEIVRTGILRTRSVDITFNGETFRHSHRTVGNHLVVSTSWLMENFGWDRARASHQHGDIFSSADTAALAWALTYFPQSNQRGDPRELSSNIIRGNGGYYFDEVLRGGRSWVGVREIRADQTRAAIIHSHPQISGFRYNSFSPEDMQTMRALGVPSYLASPDGRLRVTYDWTNNRGNRRNTIRTVYSNLAYNLRG